MSKPAVGASVQMTRDDDIVTLTLHNPDRLNALTGYGANFSAGADLGGFNEATVQQCRTRLKRGGVALMRELIAGPKPLIAAVEGHAFGAGMLSS